MAEAAILKNPTRPEVVFSGQTVVDTSISYTNNRKSLSVSCYFLAPCDKHKHIAHTHQQAASQASMDSSWRHAIRWKHSWFRGSKGCCHGNHFWLSIYGVHSGATWRIRLNRPCAAAMRPYGKLLWPLVKAGTDHGQATGRGQYYVFLADVKDLKVICNDFLVVKVNCWSHALI